MDGTKQLETSTLRRLRYAHGYLTLGLLAEASVELEGIPSADRDAPEVLEARMHLRYVGKKWPELFDLSTRCTEIFPARLEGWINLAFAARRLKGVESAKAILLEVDPAFGKTCALVPYNLACYHCLLGELADARRRLARAFDLEPSLRKVALADDDLKLLWAEIAAVE
jgi:hypothetical protein